MSRSGSKWNRVPDARGRALSKSLRAPVVPTPAYVHSRHTTCRRACRRWSRRARPSYGAPPNSSARGEAKPQFSGARRETKRNAARHRARECVSRTNSVRRAGRPRARHQRCVDRLGLVPYNGPPRTSSQGSGGTLLEPTVSDASRSALDPQQVLEGVFGYREFRPGQRHLIDAVLRGRDCIGVMPTGAGKSIAFQIPAKILPGAVLVLSPLISLMKDQVDALVRLGFRATL